MTAPDRRRALLVDAYADEPLAGVASGVVPDAAGLADEQLRAIARELAAEATAFLFPAEGADRRMRFVTPSGEVDRSHPATVAAAAHRHAEGELGAGTHTVETAAGALAVEIDDGGTVWVPHERPAVETVALDYDRAGGALGIDPAALRDVGADLPPGRSAGGQFLVVPVNFLGSLSGAAPDADALAALAGAHDVAGVYAFTFDALDAGSTLHGRLFRPGDRGPERVPAADAAAACGAYLDAVEAFDEPPDELVFEGGHFLDRPGRVRLDDGPRLRVGGRAATALDGSLAVPGGDDDGIIEA